MNRTRFETESVETALSSPPPDKASPLGSLSIPSITSPEPPNRFSSIFPQRKLSDPSSVHLPRSTQSVPPPAKRSTSTKFNGNNPKPTPKTLTSELSNTLNLSKLLKGPISEERKNTTVVLPVLDPYGKPVVDWENENEIQHQVETYAMERTKATEETLQPGSATSIQLVQELQQHLASKAAEANTAPKSKYTKLWTSN